MTRAIRTPFYELHLLVEGSGTFPLDMLRYDSAFPADESQSHKLEGHRHERRAVALCRRGVSPTLHPNSLARWKSHGWEVTLQTPDRGFVLSRAEARNAELQKARGE